MIVIILIAVVATCATRAGLALLAYWAKVQDAANEMQTMRLLLGDFVSKPKSCT